MATAKTNGPCTNLLKEKRLSVARDAALDADRLIGVLHALGVGLTPIGLRFLPDSFLLRLAAALRFYFWERQGYSFHRDAGLPEAMEIVRQVFATAFDPSVDPSELGDAAIRLSLNHFAWHTISDSQAEVVIDGELDDEALDAIADFLWSNRNFSLS